MELTNEQFTLENTARGVTCRRKWEIREPSGVKKQNKNKTVITFSFLQQFLCPCQDEETGVESFSSYQAVSGPVETAKPPKKERALPSEILTICHRHAATYGFLLGCKSSRFHSQNKKNKQNKTATRPPSSVQRQCHAVELSCYFPRQC